MNKFLTLPSSSTTIALICCSSSVFCSPFTSLSTKILFTACAVILPFLKAPYNVLGYSLSLIVSNFVLIHDPNLYSIIQEWHYPFFATNICAIGLFLVCKEISEWNIIDYLSNKYVWKSLPEIRFLEEYTPPNTRFSGLFNQELKHESDESSEFTETDFKVDMQGGVQGLLQTTTKPIKYGEKLLGYIQVVTQVQLPQSALYDLFTSLDGAESTYKELFGHGLDHARFMLDPKGNIVSWNPGVSKLLGYSRDDTIGKHLSMFYVIEDRIAGRPLADLVSARSEGHLETECWMQRKDSELFWANINITAVHNNSGQLLGFSAAARDFSEKKRNLESLRLTEEKYHLLVSSVTDYTIIMLDRTGIITTWNAGAQKINGYHAEEVIGRHFSIFYDEEALAARQPELELEKATAEGRFEEEGWRVRKDGTRFYANVVLSAIYNGRKEIVGFSKVTRDITDKIKAQAAQEELRMVEERFQLLISTVRDYAIFMLDPNGIIVSWNLGAQRIKGYEAEEVIGKHFSIAYTAEDVAHGKPQFALNTAAAEGRYEDEGLRVRKDGSTFWANVIITPIRDATGKLVGYSKVTRDVTERRQTETALRTAMQNAQAAALAKQSFLAMMSHEIRTPLHAVITLSFLLQSSELNPMQRDYLETIHNSSKQLLSIINDILDFSKIESGKLDLVVKPFNLRHCIEETIDLVLVKPITPKPFNQIDVVYILSPEVPEHIISDTVRVRQILMNYISNAIKFTEKGEVIVKVTCEPKEYQENDTVELTFAVHDTGIGIKSPNLDDLFQPFFQINHDSSQQVYGGTGLGLVISKKLSQLMGGNVWVESQEGIGSTFFFSISAQVGTITRPLSSPIPMRTLVVDESNSGSEALALLLQQFGCTTSCARTLADARELVEREKFDALFVTRTFHAQHPEYVLGMHTDSSCCALYLTGTPDSSEYHTTNIPAGTHDGGQFRAFLPKPYRTDAVRSLVHALRGKSMSIAVNSSPLESPFASPMISPSLTPLRILVAEDNCVNRKVAARILERLGYTDFDMVENGKEVLTALEKKPYDVILMDIQMPCMDGWTATQEILKRYPVGIRPEIIAMTAYAYEHDQQKCAQLGMKGHIAKPVDMALLADMLRACPKKFVV